MPIANYADMVRQLMMRAMPVGDVINAQNRFRGMRTNPYTEMGAPAEGGGRGYTPSLNVGQYPGQGQVIDMKRPPSAGDTVQTSFGGDPAALRAQFEISRYGRELSARERDLLSKVTW